MEDGSVFLVAVADSTVLLKWQANKSFLTAVPFSDLVGNVTPSAARCRYRLHGFSLESELEFPELTHDDSASIPDVTLRFGQVPTEIENPRQSGVCYQARRQEMLLWLDGVARFHVVEGRAITIERHPGAADDSIRALAYSSPLAALLLQRGLLALHASAVATADGAILFVGAAAQGKSTLAAEFARRGCVVLADDIAALRVDEDEEVVVLPGAAVLHLWPDVLATGGPHVGRPFLRPGVGKRQVSFAGDRPTGATPLVAIYVLERGEISPGGTALSRLTGKEAMVTMLDAVYRPAFVRGLQLERQVFKQTERLARETRIVRAIAPVNRFALAELAMGILKDLAR